MKRGSALLIVLGMMAFIIISAVAFSAWMRYNRLPSSYLRRTSSARLLAKAALAEAIDIVDASIGNNPHPGIGGTEAPARCWYPSRENSRQNDLDRPLYNTWRNRVYVGTNETASLLASCDTVSTLTAEALAYLPPALINEARYYSRHSLGGTWHDLNYGAGRFAFCAVDVSDYLDINRIPANMGRSALPESRFSLAHVFGKADQTDYAEGCDPEKWDDFMKNFVDVDAIKGVTAQSSGQQQGQTGSKLPLTSLADWNLALWDKDNTLAQTLSPFCRYFSGNGDELITSTSGDAAEMLRRATFVTESWFPARSDAGGANGQAEDYDLTNDEYQPFSEDMLKKDNRENIRTIIQHSSKGATRLASLISPFGLVSLFDYLDRDNVPVSLAIPQVERTPMICGIKVNEGADALTLGIKAVGDKKYEFQPEGWDGKLTSNEYPAGDEWGGKAATQEGQTRTIKYKKKYYLDASKFTQLFKSGSIQALMAYPFRSGADTAKRGTFSVSGFVGFFFTIGDFAFRTGNADDVLHQCLEDSPNKNGKDPFREFDFKYNSVICAPLLQQDYSFTDISPVSPLDFTFEKDEKGTQIPKAVTELFDTRPFLTVTFEETQTSKKKPSTVEGAPPEYEWEPGTPTRTEAVCDIAPLGSDGNVAYPDSAAVLKALAGDQPPDVSLRMAVWLRVASEGQTVDLVPASMKDDKPFGLADNYQTMRQDYDICGKVNPIMRFTFGSFKFSEKEFEENTAPISLAVVPKGVMCPDPRWNWAPEHWFQNDNVDQLVDEAKWLVACGIGKGRRDEDVYMATSDAGYLQSVYELAFLPRFSDLEADDNGAFVSSRPYVDDFRGNMKQPDEEEERRTAWATELGGVMNWTGEDGKELMWRTYCPYVRVTEEVGRIGYDRFSPDEGTFVSEGGGIKINPYSDSANVIMTAFANTPLDWWVASACDSVYESNVNLQRDNAKAFNRKYAFSSLSGADVQFAWGHLEAIAKQFSARARELVRDHAQEAKGGTGEEVDYRLDWQDAFDEIFTLNRKDKKNFLGDIDLAAADATTGKTTDPLYGIDRRFLYGYWRDCFDVRQQLFLIFVRAEPSMMGGGSVRETPPSLGARAVALVWRDPSFVKPVGSASVVPPHRTRVLFYRQFE